jgi:hypothetical protein
MSDRLLGIITGLQRLVESEQIRGDDIRNAHEAENDEHRTRLDQLLTMIDRVRNALMAEIRKFPPSVVETQNMNIHAGQAATGKTLQDQREALAQAKRV